MRMLNRKTESYRRPSRRTFTVRSSSIYARVSKIFQINGKDTFVPLCLFGPNHLESLFACSYFPVAFRVLEADTNLTSIEVTNGVGLPVRRNGNNARNTVFGMLSSYQIVKNPPQGQWHMIGYFGGEEGEAEECDEVATCATADSSSTSNIHHADSAAVFLQVSQESNNSKEDRSEGLNGNKGQSTVTFHLKSKSGIAIDSFIKAVSTHCGFGGLAS